MASNRVETQWAKNLASYVNERPLHHMSHRAGVSLDKVVRVHKV